jgi:hypothetical protein
VPPEEFVDPFAGDATRATDPNSSAPVAPRTDASLLHARLLLGPANGCQLALPPDAPPEIFVRLEENNIAVLAPNGIGAHAYRKVFDRVYRWVGSSRSP